MRGLTGSCSCSAPLFGEFLRAWSGDLLEELQQPARTTAPISFRQRINALDKAGAVIDGDGEESGTALGHVESSPYEL
jgi:hypothetical protein